MTAQITQESFEAFLKCPKKSYLVSRGRIDAQSEFYEWQRRLEENYKEATSARLRASILQNEVMGLLARQEATVRLEEGLARQGAAHGTLIGVSSFLLALCMRTLPSGLQFFPTHRETPRS